MFFLSDDPLFSDEELLLMCAESGGKTVEDTATGNPLTFTTDIARPLKSLLIPFTPQQEWSGDPSPSNIRSILPWNGLKVFGGGKNLLNPNTDEWKKRLETYLYINGVVPAGATARFTLEVKDDTADISGCYLGFVAEDLAESSPVNYRWVIENGTVKSDMSNLSSGSAQFQRRCSNVFIYPATNETVQKLFNRFNIMVELGTTATAYEPYVPITETDIVFPPPVYGGTLDVVSGVLTVDTVCDTFTWGNARTSADLTNVTRKVFELSNLVVNTTTKDGKYCDKAIFRNDYSADTVHFYTVVVNGTPLAYVYLPIGTPDTETVQIAYPLATPQEIQLTQQQITAIVGDNTIWSDADGSMTAVYLKKG